MVSAAEIQTYTNITIWTVMFIFVFFLFNNFVRNRIMVEILEYVDGGFISKSFRSRIDIDKMTKTKHLKYMIGREVIYKPRDKYFKKVSSIPFIGIKRHITFIKDGVDLKVVLPNEDHEKNANIYVLDYKRWLFLRDREDFLTDQKKYKMAQFFNIYAPVVIIVMTLVFFIITIVAQVGILNSIPGRLDEVLTAVAHLN